MARREVAPSVRVVCEDWVSHPMSPDRAPDWAASVKCSNDHRVVPADEFPVTGSRRDEWEEA